MPLGSEKQTPLWGAFSGSLSLCKAQIYEEGKGRDTCGKAEYPPNAKTAGNRPRGKIHKDAAQIG